MDECSVKLAELHSAECRVQRKTDCKYREHDTCTCTVKVRVQSIEDLFSLGDLLSHFRPCDDTLGNSCFRIVE